MWIVFLPGLTMTDFPLAADLRAAPPAWPDIFFRKNPGIFIRRLKGVPTSFYGMGELTSNAKLDFLEHFFPNTSSIYATLVAGN